MALHRWSVERFEREAEVLRRLQAGLLEPSFAEGHSRRELAAAFEAEVPTLRTLLHPRVVEEFFATAALHPDADMRKLFLRYAATLSDREPAARELILWLLGTDEDYHVVFEALRVAGEQRIGEALYDLFEITKFSTERIATSYKPVGVGSALVLHTILQIFGTEDPADIQRHEDAFVAERRLPPGTQFDEDRLYRPDLISPVSGMIEIPGGSFIVGIDRDELGNPIFDVSDAVPSRTISLPMFLIDRYPVTNREYDAWADSSGAREHLLCHADEPADKDHRRGVRRDERLRPDHPATGVDWFDAYSYCAHHGKELPSEFEWEKAARGTDGRRYPWGDAWDAHNARSAVSVFGQPIDGLSRWRELLRSVTDDHPAQLTVPVSAHDHAASPYGVRDLIGNVWEWTRTNFFTQRELAPKTKDSPRPEWLTAKASYPVIRGGAWCSIADELTAYFRGNDVLTDRHNEIGFRGVIR
ncbi:MAG: formylglycine-generating enzyme family protein [Candidatus Eremiobacteraeota bacterium]|nr:formylglycine-generating enzyme family protein [Candidatus Eremiobacteraeota bacterium]